MIIIYGIKQQLNPIKAKLSDTIHGCMQSVLGLPEGKRAHRFVPMEKEDFYYPNDRSDAYTVIEINLMAGRKVETKKQLIKVLFTEIDAQCKISPNDVEITLHEQPPHCWGFRNMTGDEVTDLSYNVNV